MTDDTTTIAVSPDTRDDLKALRRADGETLESVICRLISEYDGETDGVDEARVRELAREEIRDVVVMEALER